MATLNASDTLARELRKKWPKMEAARQAGSRRAAIRQFCLTCMGGDLAEVRRCASSECPLHPFRMGTFHGDQGTAADEGDPESGS